jgi:hypothetical protein
LRAEARPIRRLDYTRAKSTRDPDSLVGAAIVHYDHFIHERHRSQAALDRRFLVFGDHNERKTRQGFSEKGSSKITGDMM